MRLKGLDNEGQIMAPLLDGMDKERKVKENNGTEDRGKALGVDQSSKQLDIFPGAWY